MVSEYKLFKRSNKANKASNVAFQTCGLKKYGKKVRKNEMFYNVMY
jgi:hypothetical protein